MQIEKICEGCKKPYWGQDWRKSKYCSVKCRANYSSNKGRFVKGQNSNEKHPLWKGDEVGYEAVHAWVKKWKPKPKCCEMCGIEKEWLDLANLDHTYKRVLDDYLYFCRSCHRKHDMEYNGLKMKIGKDNYYDRWKKVWRN